MSEETRPAVPAAETRAVTPLGWLTYGLAVAVIALDQFSKYLILEVVDLPSRGAITVAPFFQRLIDGGADSLPITDPRMTRFWITLEQGVNFVLSSLEQMRGGEVFVPKIPATTVTQLAQAMAPSHPTRLVGIRPGEKLHEMMISADDARQTVDLGDRYAVEPDFVEYPRESFADTGEGRRVAEGFAYSSDTNDERLDARGLMRLLARAHS